jgi:hypothetical protein
MGYVTAAAGLPWAAALGCRLAEAILGEQADSDPILLPSRLGQWGWLNRVIGRPAVFALSHAWVKHSG